MFDFKYFTPTKVVFGKNTEDQVADLIKAFGGTRVLIHYGGGSVVRSGLLKKVTDRLDAAGISYDKQKFVPHITLVRKMNGNWKQIPAPKGDMTVKKISLIFFLPSAEAVPSIPPRPSATVWPTTGMSGISMIIKERLRDACRSA